jgi:purine-nucleoside/S-methyl-5'-thioadenosine phosphorylase / adenosine deaminase
VIQRQAERCEYLQFERLAAVSGLVHAVFTRRGGYSRPPFQGLNLGGVVGDDRATVRRNRQLVIAALGLPLLGARTIHGGEVTVVERPKGPPEEWHEPLRQRLLQTGADAMIANQSGFALCWAFADCAPILLYDPLHRAFALVHAGWRGTAVAIVPRAVAAMGERFGSRPRDVLAGVGPAIGACCYEIGENVQTAFAANALAAECAHIEERRGEDGAMHRYLDVTASNVSQLRAAGVPIANIEAAEYCTGCRTDLFFSNRVEPKPTGRFAVAIGLRE